MPRAAAPLAAAALLAASAPAHAGEPWRLVDAGRPDDGRGPVALVVSTPGVSPRAWDAAVEAMEAEGLDVLQLELPPAAQDAGRVVAEAIPAALAEVGDRPVVLVGHGPGGTLAAMAAVALPPERRPQALALLGAPLRFIPLRLTRHLASRPLPPGGVDLAALAASAPTWNDQPLVPLLLGDEPLPLDRAATGWLETLGGWVREGLRVDLAPLGPVPVWAGAGAADALAPVETVRPALRPTDAFTRYGYLALKTQEYDHSDLLAEPGPARDLAAWALPVLAAAGGD